MPDDLPLSVWATAQQPSAQQRRGRYVPESITHPARMLPDVARHAIRAYTKPGDLVMDPMCGIGTTLVEAAHLGLDSIGVEYERHWAALASENIDLAASQGASGQARVIVGDATRLRHLLEPALHGRVGLVLTSPPYGPSTHGRAKSSAAAPVQRWGDRYSDGPSNLAYRGTAGLLDGFAQILTGCMPFLRPQGIVVVTARPWRRDGVLIDLPAAIAGIAKKVGLSPLERQVALLTGLRDDRLVPRASFFQMQQVRRARRAGQPLRIIAHEDVLVFRQQ